MRMNRYLLDTSALLTLRDDEAGAENVANLLYQAQNQQVECFACFMTLMELLYRVWRDESESAGRLAYEQCQSLPITWIHEDRMLLEKAAEIKATYRLSLADVWIAGARHCPFSEPMSHSAPPLQTLASRASARATCLGIPISW